MKKWFLVALMLFSSCGAQSQTPVIEKDAPVITDKTTAPYALWPRVVKVDGIPVMWEQGVIGGDYLAWAEDWLFFCKIKVDVGKILRNGDNLTKVIAHEYGHCVDYWKIFKSHNGFTNEGCKFGSYFCTPAEGFAQFYAEDYYERCGDNLKVFNIPWLPSNDPVCPLTDPRVIRPQPQ